MKDSEKITDYVIAGDINSIRDKRLDAIGGNPKVYPDSNNKIDELLSDFELVDVLREKMAVKH